MRMKTGIFFLPFISTLAVQSLLAQEKSAAIKVGDPAPAPNLERVLQAPVEKLQSWDNLKGKAVILEFWGTWCGPCVAAIPHLNTLVEKFKNRPVQFASITDEEEWRVQNFLKIKSMSSWIGLDADRSMFTDYGVGPLPRTVIVDQKGTVVALTHPRRIDEQLIHQLLSGKQIDLTAHERVPVAAETTETPIIEVRILPSPPAGSMSIRGSTFQAKGMALKRALSLAFRVTPTRVMFDSPLAETTYAFQVGLPEQRSDSLHSFLQEVLTTAFGLEMRREVRELDVLVLTVSETGKTLRKAEQQAAILSDDGQMTSRGTYMQYFANVLEGNLKRVVIDETGLEGLFDLAVYWDKERPDSVFPAIREQLGLELVPAKRPVEILLFEARAN